MFLYRSYDLQACGINTGGFRNGFFATVANAGCFRKTNRLLLFCCEQFLPIIIRIQDLAIISIHGSTNIGLFSRHASVCMDYVFLTVVNEIYNMILITDLSCANNLMSILNSRFKIIVFESSVSKNRRACFCQFGYDFKRGFFARPQAPEHHLRISCIMNNALFILRENALHETLIGMLVT